MANIQPIIGPEGNIESYVDFDTGQYYTGQNATGGWTNQQTGEIYTPESGAVSKPTMQTEQQKKDAIYDTGDINITSGNAAQITQQILRGQYQNWVEQFKPIEERAIKMLSYNNPDVLNEAVGKAVGSAEMTAKANSGILERTNRALGISLNEQQAATSKRILDLNKAAGIAGAANQARAKVREQDESILLGTAANPLVKDI